jgi:hypothetical protein
MNKERKFNPNSLSNLKPIQKGEVRNTSGNAGRKKGLDRLFKECVTQEEWKAIIAKGVEQALEGDNKAREFLFSYAYGKPNVMIDLIDSKGQTFIQNNFNVEVKGKSEDDLSQLLIELSSEEQNEDEESSENLE